MGRSPPRRWNWKETSHRFSAQPNSKNFRGELMFTNKLIAAGVLSLSALAFSVPAMAYMGFGNRNYSGRYACHEDDGANSNLANPQGGVTGTYVVQPNGMGAYYGGELVFNASALWGDDPCTFTLETSGMDESTYWIDSSGVVHETLNWTDDTMDACAGDDFTQNIEASLSLPNQLAPANQTKTTSNINITIDATPISFAGTGECVSSAN
jgi:hypothetical protein